MSVHERDIKGQSLTCKALTQHGFKCENMASVEITCTENPFKIRLCGRHATSLRRNTILPLTGRQTAVLKDGVSQIVGGIGR